MDKRLLQIFCFIIFSTWISLAESGEKRYDEQNIYNLPGLIVKMARDLQNSIRLKALKPLDVPQLQDIHDEFEFKPLNSDLQIPFQNTSKCMQDLLYMVQNIRSQWGLKMIDSYGKPGSGILNGNFRWIGDYNECVGIRVSNPDSNSTIGNFRGKYCSLTWSLKSLNLSLPVQFTSGICIPDSCSAEEFQQDALQLLQMAGILPVLNDTNSTLNSDALKCKPTERHLSAGATAMIVLLSVFCALTVLGSGITAVRYFKKIIQETRTPGACDINELVKVDPNNIHGALSDEAILQDDETVAIKDSVLRKMEPYLLCFCVFTNGAKLLNTDSSEGELLCIHAIRFLSMSWVILGHSYTYGNALMSNMLEVLNTINTFMFQAILQGAFSVDSFFVLSGFLLTFLSMKQFSKTKGSISWPYFYIHRYLRLTPMYMILLGFWATLFIYLGSGPYWPDSGNDPDCPKVWWRNLLYINNFNIEAGQCFGWSWYLANDMQFFIISPLFLITLWRWPKIGYSLIAVSLLVSCLSSFFITYHFDLENGFITFLNNNDKSLVFNMGDLQAKTLLYYDKLYIKPYTRIGSYLVGMTTGYIFFKRKVTNAPKHSLVFLTVGWIVASSVTLTTVYGLYHANPGLIARSFYNALGRICWAGGLSWVIYVCLMGQGGFINRLLSFKLFIPLSRLTYAAYLIHLFIIGGYLQSLRSSLVFSHSTMVTLFLGFIIVTYALALPVTLILESPLVALEKLIRKKSTTEQKTEVGN